MLLVAGRGAYYLYRFATTGEFAPVILPFEALAILGVAWAEVVVVRQAQLRWQKTRNWALISHLALLFIGILLIFFAGATSVISQSGGSTPAPIEFTRVYVVAVGITFIGFSYLLYHDASNFRVNRVIATALVLLQTAFTMLGILYAVQFFDDDLYLAATAGALRPEGFSATDVNQRQELDAGTRPVFIAQAGISLLATGLLLAAGARVETLDQHLLNLPISQRQAEITRLVAEGQTNQEIASKLFVSEDTVKYHLKLIYEVVKVKDRRGLAQWYRQRTN